MVGVIFFLQKRNIQTIQTLNDNEYVSLLDELNPNIEPVGYFSDPKNYDFIQGKTDREEWLSKIVYTTEYSTTSAIEANSRSHFPYQKEIFSTIVKVVCTDSNDEYSYSGSGTNFIDSGYILTNLHVVKDGDEVLSCMVGFPDPETGLIREAYWATPIIDDDNESNLDLALLSIDDPVFDEELNVYGYYDHILDESFPVHEESEECLNSTPVLGEQIYILGYPYLTGGALTITDGLVSSLYSQDGYIITSAKISSGNSGGIAVDTNGCYVGVPTATYAEESEEQYGEIIDAQFVEEFSEYVSDEIDTYLSEGI